MMKKAVTSYVNAIVHFVLENSRIHLFTDF